MQNAFKFDADPANAEKQRALPKADYSFPADPNKANGIVLVGEAPGMEEARQGRPFVGRSGQLLDKILAAAGVERKECLVANVFRFQPPGNKIDHFFISRRAAKQQGVAIAEELGPFGSAWCRKEFAGELQYLKKALEEYSRSGESNSQQDQRNSLPLAGRVRVGGAHTSTAPEFLAPQHQYKKIIVVALGRTPLWALTGENELLKKVGKPLPCRLMPETAVIPTFHPSFILRGNWARQDEWAGHLATALKSI